MISDYVDPSTYTKKELADENNFIRLLSKEIQAEGVDFDYLEVTTLDDINSGLKKYDKKDTVVFNWCEYLSQQEDTAWLVTRYLEANNYVFTGASTECLKLTGSKEATKKVLVESHIPTPNYCVAKNMSDLKNVSLPFPLMLKLEDRHASAGITNANIVNTKEALVKRGAQLFTKYHTGVLVEQFVAGPEYTATLWGNGPQIACIYLTEEAYLDQTVSQISTEDTKFDDSSTESNNVKSIEFTNPKIVNTIKDIVIKSYTVLGFHDYGRFELRQDDSGTYVIDCNANQWLGMDAVLFKGTKKLGLNFGQTILQICKFAVQRYMQ